MKDKISCLKFLEIYLVHSNEEKHLHSNEKRFILLNATNKKRYMCSIIKEKDEIYVVHCNEEIQNSKSIYVENVYILYKATKLEYPMK